MNLVQKFFAIGIVSIGLTTIMLGWIMSTYLTQSMLDREKVVTADYVEKIVRAHLTLKELRELSRARHQDQFKEITEGLLNLPEAARVKVFDSRGTVVWSDEPGIVGLNFKDDIQVRQALDGTVVVSLEEIRPTAEHAFELGRFKELTAIYVPILDPDANKVLAVFELYKIPVLLRTTISHSRMILWLIALAGGALLFVAQYSLVRGAARTITNQNKELEHRAADLEEINAELRSAQDQILRSERLAAIGEVTAAVAHGIRNPLANIRAVAQETQQDRPEGDEVRMRLGEIIEQADRLEARLRAFLNSTRPFEISLAPERVEDLFDDVLSLIDRDLKAVGAAVTPLFAEGLPTVRWDRIKIQQVFQEVLVNSLEAGARTIRARFDPALEDGVPHVRISIEDDGAGLAPAAASKAFDPFFTTKAQGTGMGLAAVRRIVESHRGTVSIEERAGGGARVVLQIPVDPGAEDI